MAEMYVNVDFVKLFVQRSEFNLENRALQELSTAASSSSSSSSSSSMIATLTVT